MGNGHGPSAPLGDEGPDGDYILAVEGMFKTFDDQQLYQGVDLAIRPGEIVVIIGQSGMGKSVFIKHLIGLEDPTRGSVWYRIREVGGGGQGPSFRDLPIHALAEDQMGPIRRDVSIVFQESSLFDWMTVYDNIALPLVEHRELMLERVRRLAEHPRELVRLLARSPRPAPGPVEDVLRGLDEGRSRVAAAAGPLSAGLDDEALLSVLLALACDTAHTLGLSEPDMRAWEERRVRALVGLFQPETMGRFLALLGEGELTGSLAEYRATAMGADAALRTAWASVRAGLASTGFRPLEEALAAWTTTALGESTGPVGRAEAVRQFLARSGWSTRAPTLAGLYAETLCLFKERPWAASNMLLVGYPDGAPGPWKEFAEESARFAQKMEALRSVTATPDEEARAVTLAWLARHPLQVDRKIHGLALTRQVVAKLAQRPEDLGECLGRLSSNLFPSPIAEFVATYGAYRQTLLDSFKHVLDLPKGRQAEIFTELVVSGLMNVLKLDPVRDREKLPSQLSGGMKTRVGIARSLAILPRVVLYDEPTAGLDPLLSKAIAREILALQASGVVTTSVVVTHDKELYWTLRESGRTRMLYLHKGRFLNAHGEPVADHLRFSDAPRVAAGVVPEAMAFIREFEPASPGEEDLLMPASAPASGPGPDLRL